MYVTKHMTLNPLTISPQTTIAEAREILKSNNFRHLPIINESGVLQGIVTDRDIRSAYPSNVTGVSSEQEYEKVGKSFVSEIMSSVITTLNKFSTLDDALLLLDHNKVGAVPVVDDNDNVIGVFSIRDLIFAYKGLFGLGERGSALIEIKNDGKPRPLTRIVQALEKHDIHFSRVVRKNDENNPDYPELIYIRVSTFNIRAVHSALSAEGFESA